MKWFATSDQPTVLTPEQENAFLKAQINERDERIRIIENQRECLIRLINQILLPPKKP